jgi:hypothetical protein
MLKTNINLGDLESLIPLLIESVIPTDDLHPQKLLPALISCPGCSLIPTIYIFPAWNCVSQHIKCPICTLLLQDRTVGHTIIVVC